MNSQVMPLIYCNHCILFAMEYYTAKPGKSLIYHNKTAKVYI